MLGRKRLTERKWHWIERQLQGAAAQDKLRQDPIGTAEKRILIRLYGDSLSMPRIVDGIRYIDSFPELLRQGLSELHPGADVLLYNRSMGGAPIGELQQQWENNTFYFGPGGHLLVVQVGVVDCAPRPLSKKHAPHSGPASVQRASPSSSSCITIGLASCKADWARV